MIPALGCSVDPSNSWGFVKGETVLCTGVGAGRGRGWAGAGVVRRSKGEETRWRGRVPKICGA
jgi:hypothetical protein